MRWIRTCARSWKKAHGAAFEWCGTIGALLRERPRLNRVVAVLAVLLVVVGLAGAVGASRALTGGAQEIPAHWWSTIAAAPAAVGLLALAARRFVARC